jgi:pyruvate formate lyase activating enzyme
LACAACGGVGAYYAGQRIAGAAPPEVFRRDAPQGALWEAWLARGWAREARHYRALGENVHCQLCPNGCLLEPEDRGRCRGRVNKDGKLYTLSYGAACAFHVDPVEKKPLFHYLPGTTTFSFATTGCGFRCLNCQNWDLSQRKPEELKDPRGGEVRLISRRWPLGADDPERVSFFPDDLVELVAYLGCPSVSYTYSEPVVWFEYMMDCAKAARAAKLKNICVTCGYIQPEPLAELCKVIDAAHVDLKSFDETIYRDLNSGKLEPVLETMKTLRRAGVWFEVINLVVPHYTDQPAMIRRMCDWLAANLGPDCPLHFSRFHPAHQLRHLTPTPAEVLVEARQIARDAGLRYVYIGNTQDVDDPETTYCPGCRKAVIRRRVYEVQAVELESGKCRNCGQAIAGVWSA